MIMLCLMPGYSHAVSDTDFMRVVKCTRTAIGKLRMMRKNNIYFPGSSVTILHTFDGLIMINARYSQIKYAVTQIVNA